ncbi:uncharacterized protein BCR38DRAFT_452403 [Pseudomassariella vexata]|uniref:Autophagy protein n=1 Tax=Pseudomassariella vexata TaxID=1141098 RepID=A0A1Y2D885_9PEZI|nr:uncharacterized protein BCR38DRAFT_452403 [Pseudomassariella vexata]ORY55478.1 hypothetical protein BCR38DRAFT_452403 [Pseudomassariella vexata]
MGWWGSLWSSSSTQDPLSKLDPKLREFLEKESPVKYKSQPAAKPQSAHAPQTTCRDKPTVPKESEFQDGRYAHLWKNYRPLAEVENETKSDHEKLMDVLEGYKERRSQIGRAALENCAMEQFDWRTCMMNPSVSERMTLCRTQVRKFEKCYMTQTRLLKALGYLSMNDRSPEVEEEIQMHADTLYHRMLEQEAQIEAAKEKGEPVPTFPPLIIKNATAPVEVELTPAQQEQLKARLEKVAEEDRYAEEVSYKAEMRARAETAEKLQALWKKQEDERQQRKMEGKETIWDKATGAFRSNAPEEKK